MNIRDQYLDERFIAPLVSHPPLPFFHVCPAIHLQPILDTRELQPQYCNVYKEKLLYLNWGKPAYKSSNKTSSRLNSMMPVIFIINYDAVTSIHRAAPFDSGAFSLYAEHMHEDMKLEQFHLTPSKEGIDKTKNYFYSDNDSYFNGVAKKDLEPYDSIHFQIESAYSILTSSHKMIADDRKAVIEVQLDHSIKLDQFNIEAIVLPRFLAESPIVKGIFDAEKITVLPITNYGVPSSDYYVYTLEVVKDYLRKKNLLNG